MKQYKKYKLAAGKTAKSILISCGARLAPFDIEELRELMSYDELELDTLGDRKTALFLIMSDTDDTFNFVIAILQSQLFNLLCDKADDEYNGKLPIHVRFLLDEFANIGQIPRFDKYLIMPTAPCFWEDVGKMQRIFRITWDGKQSTVSTLPKIAARRFLMDLLIKN